MGFINDDDVNTLRREILRQACTDFIGFKQIIHRTKRGLYRGTSLSKRDASKYVVQRDLDDLIDFFYSDWFVHLYPNVDPQCVIDYLDAEYDKWELEYNSKHPEQKKTKPAIPYRDVYRRSYEGIPRTNH